jgi:hypothetical protein
MISYIIRVQICKLYLGLNNAGDAVTQFQKHMRIYKHTIGIKELEFDHWAWVARQ